MPSKLRDYAMVAEIASAIAVVVSVLYLGKQINDNTRLLRSQAQEAGKRSAAAQLGSLRNIAEFLVESLRNLAWAEEVFSSPGKIQILPIANFVPNWLLCWYYYRVLKQHFLSNLFLMQVMVYCNIRLRSFVLFQTT